MKAGATVLNLDSTGAIFRGSGMEFTSSKSPLASTVTLASGSTPATPWRFSWALVGTSVGVTTLTMTSPVASSRLALQYRRRI